MGPGADDGEGDADRDAHLSAVVSLLRQVVAADASVLTGAPSSRGPAVCSAEAGAQAVALLFAFLAHRRVALAETATDALRSVLELPDADRAAAPLWAGPDLVPRVVTTLLQRVAAPRAVAEDAE